MAGEARARACLTNSAKPCVAVSATPAEASYESGGFCTARPFEPREEHGQAGEIEVVAADIAHDFNNLLTIITTYTMLVLEELAPDDPSRPDLEQVCQAAERARQLTRELRTLGQRCSSVMVI